MNQLHLPDQTSRRFGFGFGSRPQFPADEVLAGHSPPTRRAQGLDLGLARGPQFPPEEELALLSSFLFLRSV